MAFLGKIGKAIGIGDLTHQPFKAATRIGATAAGFALGGPAGAAAGNALGTVGVGDQEGSHSLRAAGINAAKAYGLTSAGQYLYDKVPGWTASMTGTAPTTTAGASLPASTATSPVPTASVGGSGAQLVNNPDLLEQAAGLGGQSAVSVPQVGSEYLGAVGVPGGESVAASAGSSALPASTASTGGLWDKAGSLWDKYGNAALAVAPVAMSVMGGQGEYDAQNKLQAQADQMGAQGQEMLANLRSGQLPSALQGSFDQMLASEQASIRSRYASMGLAGSTMEAQDLAAADARVKGMLADQVQSMMQTGMQLTGASSNIYSNILQQNMQSDAELAQLIAAAAGSLGPVRSARTGG